MIHVFATVPVRAGCMEHALSCYRTFVPLVLAKEPGCLSYVPTTDYDLGLKNQVNSAGDILVVELWQSIDDFLLHLKMEHCVAFRQQIAPYLREGISVRVTQECMQEDLSDG